MGDKKTIIAITGLPGAGKSVVADILVEKGLEKIRFGDITDTELKKRGLTNTEENERAVREQLRKDHGNEAFAKLNLERINSIKNNIVVDGIYSYEEYEFLKQNTNANIILVAVEAQPEIRHSRLSGRNIRPFSSSESEERDTTQIANLNISKTIEKADLKIINNSDNGTETIKQKLNHLIQNL